MALITTSWLVDIIILVMTLLSSVYLYYKKKFEYWSKLNVPHTKPSIPFGNFKEANRTKQIGLVVKDIYESHKAPFLGMWIFMKPVLLIQDLDLIKSILVKDFSHFHDRGVGVDETIEPLAGHLFSMKGSKWRNLRIQLSPTFTSGKMKMMFPTVVDCSKGLISVLQEPAAKQQNVEIKDILARFTTDVIASCAFGIEINSLENPETEFRRLTNNFLKPGPIQAIFNLLVFFLPKVANFLKVSIISKEGREFFINSVKDTMEYREKNQLTRNDFMQLLIELRNKGFVKDADAWKEFGVDVKEQKDDDVNKFTMMTAAAQAFIFFVAGFETSSTTMQYTLYELALNKDIQNKTREEILKVLSKYNGKITYEAIQEMEYLDRVLAETLRKYPPAPIIFRQCTIDYKIPETDIILKKGTDVMIPVLAIHRDEKYYPDPLKFDPDRFLQKQKEKRHQFAYIPFGEGPRICIGMRFAFMNTKIGLVTLLSNYQFDVSSKTAIPLVFDPKVIILSAKGGMNLKISKL